MFSTGFFRSFLHNEVWLKNRKRVLQRPSLTPLPDFSITDDFNIRLHSVFFGLLGGCFGVFFSLVHYSGVMVAALWDILFLILNTVSEYCGLFLHTV